MEKLKALRIDGRTIIFVRPENATEEYRQKYLRRLKESAARMADIGGLCPQIEIKK
jgi:hypothetical protein